MRYGSGDKERRACIRHYSAGTNTCGCCGLKFFKCLELHHVDEDGYKRRREIGKAANDEKRDQVWQDKGHQLWCSTLNAFYQDIIDRGFEDVMAVLCANCHRASERQPDGNVYCYLHWNLIEVERKQSESREVPSPTLWEELPV